MTIFNMKVGRICVKKQLVKDKSIMHINNYIKNEIILLLYKSVSDVHGACKNIDCRLLLIRRTAVFFWT